MRLPLLRFYASELRDNARALAAIALKAMTYIAALALVGVAAQQLWLAFVAE